MGSFRLSRRTVLRGAGSIAIGLPWLELMREERSAHATGDPARRFVGVYSPGGTVHAGQDGADKWTPTGSETDFALSPILAPLAPVQKRLIVPTGLSMVSAIGEQQQAGIIALLTGTPQADSGRGYATGPSIDQVIAGLLPKTDLPSLELAVRWGTGKSHGLATPNDILSFADDKAFTPLPPRIDPVLIWQDLFGRAVPEGPPNWDKSILDYVAGRLTRLAPKLGSADKQRVEEHLTRVRELEKTLAAASAERCRPPVLVDTSDYDPKAGLKADDAGVVKDRVTDAAIPKVGKLMMDMLVMALACNKTNVATLMWADTAARYTLPWLNLNRDEVHYFYQSDGGYQPAECETIGTWYASQHSYLIQQLASVDLGAHSLLDETVVLFGSEVSDPPTHKKRDMPFLLAGGGGGLRTGRWIECNGASHNDLLVALLNLFGDPRTSFGNTAYCTGPLPNLT